MVAAIAVASAGLGMLVGVAMANISKEGGAARSAAVRWPPRCATCEGTGRVECLCSRWSDGDGSGCRTCAGTRMMPCRSCGGSGTGRRAPARIAATAAATAAPPRHVVHPRPSTREGQVDRGSQPLWIGTSGGSLRAAI